MDAISQYATENYQSSGSGTSRLDKSNMPPVVTKEIFYCFDRSNVISLATCSCQFYYHIANLEGERTLFIGHLFTFAVYKSLALSSHVE